LISDLVYELSGGDLLKADEVRKIKVTDMMVWMILKQKKDYSVWIARRNLKD
jgi:hypothetical protein